MPKTEIDYSNTIIYKITCRDPNVTDVYVGHTTNFIQRKHCHKQSCTNIKSSNYKCKLYEVIRNNGNWNNWKMEIINFFNCADHYEARQKEQIYFLELKANLNSVEPMPKPKIKPTSKSTPIHKPIPLPMPIKMATTKDDLGELTVSSPMSQNSQRFICDHCNVKTNNKKDYNKHLMTAKHKKLSNVTQKATSCPNPDTTTTYFACKNCNKNYLSRVGLWKHKKICCIMSCKEDLSNETKQQQLIDYLLKENTEFKQLMIEQNKQMIELAKKSGNINNSNNSNNTNNNTTNNSFNLQVFLNETCKNAMNIMDFVSQLPVGLTDLEETGRLGFAEGISKIFINGLKQISVNDRPLHCSDFKRETLYIKNNNEWNKETEDKAILTNAIKHVVHKNIKQISEWTKHHPEYNDSSSKQNDKYLQIVCESMSGSTAEECNKNYNKIIKNISKEIIIEK